jgi:hypothetical protein
MNLTGAKLYSKASRGLRQADVITDQQFKLVFIYPMLFDSKLQGKYGKLMRQFISVSMLKEIFVSNALHMVSLASRDHSLEGEDGERNDVYSLIGRTIAGANRDSGSGDFAMQMHRKSNKYELQQKIKEKTAVIRKLIANDHRLSQLEPYIEIITLDNMVDVPIIVGTKGYGIDSLTMAFVLSASIALNKPLDSWANVQQIFNVLENTKVEDAWQLFSNLVDNQKAPTGERIATWISDSHPKAGTWLSALASGSKELARDFGRGAGTLARRIPGIRRLAQIPAAKREYIDPIIPSRGRGTRVTDKFDPNYDPELPFKSDPAFDIMKVKKDELDDAKLFFKFMLDDNLLRTQFGLDKNPGQMSTAIKRISSQGEALFFQMHQNFMELVGYNANIPIHSFFNSIYPHESNLDYLQVKNKYLDKMLNDVVSDLNEELKTLLANTFGSEGVDTTRAKVMSQLCTAGLEQTTNMIEERTKDLAQDRLGSVTYSTDDLTTFLGTLENTASQFSATIEKLKQQLRSVLANSGAYFDKVEISIDQVVDEMIGEYDKHFTRDQEGNFDNIALNRNGVLTANNDAGGQKTISYINQGKSYLSTTILTMYYASVVDAICQYVKYLDVEIETVKNDVLDLPNYTLVIPVEVVTMLHSAIMAKTWRNLVSQDNTQATNLTDNYVKGIVKFIAKKIDVPNLIVIDSKREQVFYKLMYTSQVNKTNIKTFDTFVKNVQSKALDSPFNY